MRSLAAFIAIVVSAGCGEGDPGTRVSFDLDGRFSTEATFFDHPFPSDLRLDSEGRPDLTGFPNPRDIPIIEDLLRVAGDRVGFPVLPVAYFRFDGPIAEVSAAGVIPASPSSPVLLVDLSREPGRLIPTIALTMQIDDYMPGHGLAVAPRPGFILDGNTTYAVVVMRALGDAAGEPLGVNPALRQLLDGQLPDGSLGEAARALFQPLPSTLESIGVDPDEVAAATVFGTPDVVQDLADLTDAVLAAYSVTITGLAIDPDDGASHPRYCELLGTVTYPQFQRGTPPFNSEGLFEIDAAGLPVVQRTEEAPIVIAIPKQEMPAAGYPLMIYFHGSGGLSSQVVDRGTITEVGGEPTKGEGPAHVVAVHGIASASSALPVNPERLPGASEIAYLNFNNLSAFRDTFRQGVIESRLFLRALRDLEIPASVLAGCPGATLPSGATAFKFDPAKLAALGQSMGGMYTNLVSPTEPRIGASVPTGAGGFWHQMILETELLSGTADLLSVIIGTPVENLSFMHPGMHLLAMGWEAVEPLVFMPRLSRKPLAGHPARHVYEPVGQGDVYFSINIYDAAALAYGHQQAGQQVWPSMQQALALAGLDGILSYPVTGNLSGAGADYTGVVVQYEGDGIADPHVIYGQLDEVKYQYGCFLSTFFARGDATVPAPAPLGTPCP